MGDAGFQGLSEDFDVLIGRMNQQPGYRLVDVVDQTDPGMLRVTPIREFLLYGGRDAHMAATLAFYQMWKNHQNSRPVAVMLPDDARIFPYLRRRTAAWIARQDPVEAATRESSRR